MPRDTTQLRKGALELAILALLDTDESYAVELLERLASMPGLDAGAGTVYPLLSRLAKNGLVTTTWRESTSGPPRKYYRPTPAGRAELRAQAHSWRQLASTLDDLLKGVQ